ncbi:MAG: protein kinase [Planctomycetaceae bacterium]|nr:protein kinase [Planctomycetaceae bacterium]
MNGYKNTAELAIADVQVIDFGLASEIRSSLTRVSQMRFDTSGTRPYMAPEQWRGRPQSGQTDQYALAVVAHELLAGYLPFDGDDFEMLRAAVLQDTVEAISGMSDHINAALLTALAKDSGGRFGSCADFVSALAGGEIIKREPPTVSPHAPPKSGGHTPPGNAAPPEIVPLMDRGHLALEDSEWSKANEFFDKVLYIDAKYAPAYTGIFTGTVGMSHNGNGIPFFHRDDRLQRYHIRNAFGQKHDFCFFVPHEMESMQSHHSSGTALGHEVFVAVRIPTQPTGIDPTDSRHIIDF